MQFAAALSTEATTSQAIAEVCESALAQLGGPPDLAMLFISHHHGPAFEPLLKEIRRRTGVGCLLGCTGEAIVGPGREIEEQPAICLVAGPATGRVDPAHAS